MGPGLKPVMLQILLLVLLHNVGGREIPASEHSSRLVQVSVVEEEGDQLQVEAGPLHLHLGRAAGAQLLRRVLAEEVSNFRGRFFYRTFCQVLAEAEELVGGSLYAGRLEGEPDCEAHAFLEGNQVILSPQSRPFWISS